MVLSRAIANNIYTICGTPSLERRYPASRNGGFTAQEYSLENACSVALTHSPSPRYKNIRLILEAGQDLPKKDSPKEEIEDTVNNPASVSLLSGDRKPQIRF